MRSVFILIAASTLAYCLRQFHSSANDVDFEKHKAFGLYLLKTSRVKTWEIDVY